MKISETQENTTPVSSMVATALGKSTENLYSSTVTLPNWLNTDDRFG